MSSSNRIAPIDITMEELQSFYSARSHFDPEINLPKEFDNNNKESNNLQIEACLPITQSRNGNIWSCIFHLVSTSSNMQALFLPIAFATLGWAWGLTFISIGFLWQLYTRWLLIQLHESPSGVRYSRYMQLAMEAFGPKLARWLCMFQIIYLSSGTCTMLVITGGSTLKFLYEIICLENSHCPKNLSLSAWFLIFICIAFILAQHPNLNSLIWVSLIGTLASIIFFSLLWITTIAKGRVKDVSYDPIFKDLEAQSSRFLSTISAMELISLSFRGHNLILEIQGTLPSNYNYPSHITMWKAVRISCLLEALCIFPLAIIGYWAYGNKTLCLIDMWYYCKIPSTGILHALGDFHKDSGFGSSTTLLGLSLVFLSVHQLCTHPIYSMPSYDTIELYYFMAKNKPCSIWIRRLIRFLLCFGENFFIAMAFPFLPIISPIPGALAILLTFAYPCFMYVILKKPKVWGGMFLFNWGLGCLGVLLSVVYFFVSVWNISREGVSGRFFNPN